MQEKNQTNHIELMCQAISEEVKAANERGTPPDAGNAVKSFQRHTGVDDFNARMLFEAVLPVLLREHRRNN